MLDFSRNDFPTGYNQLSGIDITLGRRNVVRTLGVDQGRRLLVIDQVRDDQVIKSAGRQQGIHIGAGMAAGYIRIHAGLGFGHRIDIRNRRPGCPLVTLDEDDILRSAAPFLHHDAPLVDVGQGCQDLGLRGRKRSVRETLGTAEHALHRFFGIPVIRNHPVPRRIPLGLQFLRRLENREVELCDQVVIGPRRPFQVVVVELAAARKDEQQDDKQNGQSDINPPRGRKDRFPHYLKGLSFSREIYQ